ncbi:MAG: hypothetical protein IJB34_04450 [Clostridia bacterium]|nr:hypothetical protein [Clostridia bacterium]MBQ3505934.1 hypothetical protein [Clostridia bacterium]
MSTKIRYFSKGNETDGASYCSGVETLAENLIEDNEDDATIVFPSKNGWASVRSTSYKLTSENAEVVLPYPIYKIKKMLLRPAKETKQIMVYPYGNLDIPISEFKDGNGNSPQLDITDLIVPIEEWNALPRATSTEEYVKKKTKDSTFFYEKEAEKIIFSPDVYKIGTWLSPDNSPVYERLAFKASYRALYGEDDQYLRYKYVFTANESGMDADQTFYLSDDQGDLRLPTDVRDWQFRIEYIPVSSKMKIRARKVAGTTVDYIQPFNQRAEVNAASAFGKNMYLTAQKTGVREIKLVKDYTLLSEIPPIGARIRHDGKVYRLVANHYSLTNTVFLRVTHTLSENWSAKSKHVSVDQKYRNWKIPQDILWRNLYWEDYFRVGTTLKTSQDVTSGVAITNIMNGLYNSSKNAKTVKHLCWFGGKTNSAAGVIVPCSSYGIGNSLIFSATFRDNLSAGLCRVEDDLCEEALYCNEDGTLDTATVVLTSGIGNGTCSDSYIIETLDETLDNLARNKYPNFCAHGSAYNAPLDNIFKKEFLVDKDAGEALRFTYQIHLIGEDCCFFGEKFSVHNPLVKDWEGKRKTFRLWFLTHYVRESSEKLETIDGDEYLERYNDGEYFAVGLKNLTIEEQQTYGKVYRLYLEFQALNILDVNKHKAWAITDENNNLYVACNDSSVKEIYFQLHHKR